MENLNDFDDDDDRCDFVEATQSLYALDYNKNNNYYYYYACFV